MGVFSALKTAYREKAELLYRRGSNTVGKEHFTALYQRARSSAIIARDILFGWSKTGLFPSNPDRVLRGIQAPPPAPLQVDAALAPGSRSLEPLQTPTTAEGLRMLCNIGLACKAIFSAQNASIRKRKTIQRRLENHRSSPQSLIPDFDINKMAVICQTLPEKQF